jgi:hypothetical protein
MAIELRFFQRSEPFAHGKDGLPFGDGQRLPVSPERRFPLQNLFDRKGRFKGKVEKGPTIASPSHRIHRGDLIAFRTKISFHDSPPLPVFHWKYGKVEGWVDKKRQSTILRVQQEKGSVILQRFGKDLV